MRKTVLTIDVSKKAGVNKIIVKASEEFENIFKTPETDDSGFVNPDGEVIQKYRFSIGDERTMPLHMNVGITHRIELGNSKYLINSDYVNASMLLLKGISEGNGVEIKITGILLDSEIELWAENIQKIAKYFIALNSPKQYKFSVSYEL